MSLEDQLTLENAADITRTAKTTFALPGAVMRRLNCPRCKGHGVYHAHVRTVDGIEYRFAKTCDHGQAKK